MKPFQMKHRRHIPVLAAALLVAASSFALAEQEVASAPRTNNWFWSWLTSTPAPAAKPKPGTPARVAEPAKPGCVLFNCITLVGIGF
jgi:hypothetical protein